MTETIRVRAVSGAMLPDLQRSKQFVGYREVQSAESADHVVPGGKRYRLIAEGVDVPNTPYHRRAIAAGSLERLAVGITTIDGGSVVLPADGSSLEGVSVPSLPGEPKLDPESVGLAEASFGEDAVRDVTVGATRRRKGEV